MPWLRSLTALCLTASLAAAGDWPQWLGPTRDAVSPETVAPWQDAPKVLWRQPVGEGHSSPVVADGRVFLHTKVKDKDAEELTAFDALTGKPRWHAIYPRTAFKTMFGDGPRATPAVHGGHVYTFGLTGVLTCYNVADGRQVWQADTLKQFSAPNLTFGVSCSPLVEGDAVLVNVGGKGASVIAFEKERGKVAWQALDDAASYSSPIAFGEGVGRQVVFLTRQGVVSLNPVNGNLHWSYPLVDKLSESSTTPVRAGNTLLASSVTFGSAGLTLRDKGGKPGYDEAWKNSALTCYFSTPVAVGDQHVYMVTGMPLPPSATLRCVEAKTGKEMWSRPKVGKYHASLLRTGNNKLLMLDDSGNLILLDPDPRGYRELARAKVCGGTWAHLALANRKLYVRDEKELICLQLGE